MQAFFKKNTTLLVVILKKKVIQDWRDFEKKSGTEGGDFF
jgi:hypothetical protein